MGRRQGDGGRGGRAPVGPGGGGSGAGGGRGAERGGKAEGRRRKEKKSSGSPITRPAPQRWHRTRSLQRADWTSRTRELVSTVIRMPDPTACATRASTDAEAKSAHGNKTNTSHPASPGCSSQASPPDAACCRAESFNRAPPKSRSWILSVNAHSPIDRRPRFHPPTGVSAEIGPSLHLATSEALGDVGSSDVAVLVPKYRVFMNAGHAPTTIRDRSRDPRIPRAGLGPSRAAQTSFARQARTSARSRRRPSCRRPRRRAIRARRVFCDRAADARRGLKARLV